MFRSMLLLSFAAVLSDVVVVVVSEPLVDCPRCVAAQRERRLRRARLEFVKRQILDRLGLSAAPNVSSSPLEFPFIEARAGAEHGAAGDEHGAAGDEHGAAGDEHGTAGVAGGEREFGSERQVARPLHQAPCRRKRRGSICFRLSIRRAWSADTLRSLQIWLYVLAGTGPSGRSAMTLREATRPSRVVSRSELTTRQGWVAFNVSLSFVNKWAKSGRTSHRLQLHCESCSPLVLSWAGPSKGFLVATLRLPVFVRTRRSGVHTCRSRAAKQECCLESFYVEFAEIGFGFIKRPRGYSPNFCRGHCDGHPLLPHYSHTQVIQAAAGATNRQLSTCCSPRQLRPISVIFVNEDGEVIKKDLPEMIAESCACA